MAACIKEASDQLGSCLDSTGQYGSSLSAIGQDSFAFEHEIIPQYCKSSFFLVKNRNVNAYLILIAYVIIQGHVYVHCMFNATCN